MSSMSRKSVLVAAAFSAVSGAYASGQSVAIYGSPAYVGGSGGTGGVQAQGSTPVPKTNSTNPGTSVITGESLASGYIYYPSSTGGAPVSDTDESASYLINSSGTPIRLASAATDPYAPSGSTATSPLPGAVSVFGINSAANVVVGIAATGYTGAGTYSSPLAAEWNATTGAVTTFATQNSVTSIPNSTSTYSTSNSGSYNEAALVVNASGVAAGTARLYNTSNSNAFIATVPVLWTSTSAAPVILPNAGLSSSGTYGGSVYAINSSGTAVGSLYTYTSSNTYTGTAAVAWTLGATTPTLLPSAATAAGNNPSDFARVINDSGVIAGYTADPNGQTAARWTPSASGYVLQELNSVGTGYGSNGGGGDVTAINTAGDVVGNAVDYGANNTSLGTRPLLWLSGSATPIQLQVDGTTTAGSSDYSKFTPPHTTVSNKAAVYGINDADYSVGEASEFDSSGNLVIIETAELWNASGALTELNSLVGITTPTDSGSGSLASGVSGWTNLIEADGITNTGWISGYGEYYDAVGADSYERGFLIYDAAAAVPEPTSLTLLALGGIGLLQRKRRVSKSVVS